MNSYWPLVPHVVQIIITLLLLLLDFMLTRRRNRLQLKSTLDKQRYEAMYPKRSVAKPFRVVLCPPVIPVNPKVDTPATTKFPAASLLSTPHMPAGALPLSLMLQELAGGRFFQSGGLSAPGGRSMDGNSPFESSASCCSSPASALFGSVNPLAGLGQAAAAAAACVPVAAAAIPNTAVDEDSSVQSVPGTPGQQTGTNIQYPGGASYHLCPETVCKCAVAAATEVDKKKDTRNERAGGSSDNNVAETDDYSNQTFQKPQQMTLDSDLVRKLLSSSRNQDRDEREEALAADQAQADLPNEELRTEEERQAQARERTLRRFPSDGVSNAFTLNPVSERMRRINSDGVSKMAAPAQVLDKRPLLSWPTAVKITTKLRKKNRVVADPSPGASELSSLPESDQNKTTDSARRRSHAQNYTEPENFSQTADREMRRSQAQNYTEPDKFNQTADREMRRSQAQNYTEPDKFNQTADREMRRSQAQNFNVENGNSGLEAYVVDTSFSTEMLVHLSPTPSGYPSPSSSHTYIEVERDKRHRDLSPVVDVGSASDAQSAGLSPMAPRKKMKKKKKKKAFAGGESEEQRIEK